MDALPGFVEFYVTCNPPLLPRGVQYVIETARDALPEGKLVEILYEPEIPWLKCITTVEDQNEVTELIQSLLLIMMEEETSVVDTQQANLLEDDDPDVTIVADDPRLMPWSTYRSLGSDIFYEFDKYRFPETMVPLASKTVWRGLEHWEGGDSIETLLAKFRFLSKDENAPATINGFENLMNCQISHNMKENLIYIGTDEPMSVVESAVRKLERILAFTVSEPRLAAHLILTEGSDPIRIAYKWLSHVGLARTTYVQPGNSSLVDESRSLMTAATARTETQDRHERWILDKTVYSLKNGPVPDFSKAFSAFDGYLFRPKKASQTFQALPYQDIPREVVVKQQACPAPAGRESDVAPPPGPARSNDSSAAQSEPGKGPLCHGPRNDVRKGAPSEEKSKLSRGFLDSNTQPPPVPAVTTVPAITTLPAIATVPAITTAPPTVTLGTLSQSFIANWRENVQKATAQEAKKPANPTEELISFDQSDDENLGSFEILSATACSEQRNMSRMSAFAGCDDLIWLGDEPKSESLLLLDEPKSDFLLLDEPTPGLPGRVIIPERRQNACPFFGSHVSGGDLHSVNSGGEGLLDACGIVEKVSTLGVHENPLEAQDQDSDTRGDPNAVAHFGLLDERPNEFFRTMYQQGNPDRFRPLNESPISAAKGKTAAGPGAWAGQKAIRRQHVSETGGTSDPITPSGAPVNASKPEPAPKTAVDSAWPKLGEAPASPKKTKAKKPLLYSDAARPNPNVLGGCVQQGPPKFPDSKGIQLDFQGKNLHSSHEVNDGRAKLPMPEQPYNGPVGTLTEKSELLRSTELQVKAMTRILELTPGNISLEVKFGRIYIKQIAHGLVNSGPGPSFSVDEALEFLNDPNIRQSRMGFSSILTTLGGDADKLIAIKPPGEPRWGPFEKQTWYDFVCSFDDGEGPFVVEVEAETFRYKCRGPRQEVFGVYLHCPQQAWDMKVCAMRSSPLETLPKYKAFAEALVASAGIWMDNEGNVTIEIPEDESFGASVECVNIRQVARYHHKKRGGSMLTVTMTRDMQEKTTASQGVRKKTSKEKKSRIWCRPSANPNGANPNGAVPHQWFEASISSPRTKEYFDQNTRLGFGERASWDADQLESEGVFEEICRPAFGMITHMDHIGLSNDNGQGVNAQDAFHDALIDEDAQKRKWAFW